MVYEDAIQKMKGCPFCGQKDKVTITNKAIYNELMEENGNACISISCDRCGLTLYDHSYAKGITDYNDRLVLAFVKWNERNSS